MGVTTYVLLCLKWHSYRSTRLRFNHFVLVKIFLPMVNQLTAGLVNSKNSEPYLQHGHEIYWCNTTHLCMTKEINWGCFQGWRGVAWWKELCTTVWYCKRHAEYLLFFGPVLQKVWYLLSLSVLQCSTTWFLERSSVIERFLLHYLMFTQPNLLFQINNPLNLVWSG